MDMAELTCSVNTCASHSGGYCCRHGIEIDGRNAVMKDDTCCRSFQKKDSGAMNAACGSSPNPHMEIRCTAGHCTHNSNGRCTAEAVGVSGGSVTEMSETICDSFEAR